MIPHHHIVSEERLIYQKRNKLAHDPCENIHHEYVMYYQNRMIPHHHIVGEEKLIYQKISKTNDAKINPLLM